MFTIFIFRKFIYCSGSAGADSVIFALPQFIIHLAKRCVNEENNPIKSKNYISFYAFVCLNQLHVGE